MAQVDRRRRGSSKQRQPHGHGRRPGLRVYNLETLALLLWLPTHKSPARQLPRAASRRTPNVGARDKTQVRRRRSGARNVSKTERPASIDVNLHSQISSQDTPTPNSRFHHLPARSTVRVPELAGPGARLVLLVVIQLEWDSRTFYDSGFPIVAHVRILRTSAAIVVPVVPLFTGSTPCNHE